MLYLLIKSLISIEHFPPWWSALTFAIKKTFPCFHKGENKFPVQGIRHTYNSKFLMLPHEFSTASFFQYGISNFL